MKTVIVTGASGGIGSACCRKFMEEGYNVVACYCNNPEGAQALKQHSDGSNLLVVKADISRDEEIKDMFAFAKQHFGRIDVMVNNAAISCHGLIQDITPAELADIIDINIKGTFNMCRHAVSHMVANQSGSIINIASMWGETGASCEVAYSMSKAAVIGLTKALAKETGPSQIRVNCVSPGLIDTQMNSCYDACELDAISEETPLMRMGQPHEIADVVEFLAGDKSSFVTGQIIGVNGGFVI